MATGASTFHLGETFAEPQVQALPPPPVRHALLAFVVTLAAILHIGTGGWSAIHNGAEGLYASSAREMLATGSLLPIRDGAVLPNEPPLLHWFLRGSFKLGGTNAAAARLPIALAFVVSVALTFLIGERLGGYWRGFAASLIYLCSCGAYIWGRFVTPEPVFAACVAAAVYCAIAGYQQKRTRRGWFVGFALCAAAAYLTRGASALALLALIIAVPAIFFREARGRFRAVLHWSAIAAFAAIVVPWLLLLHVSSPGALLQGVWFAPFARAAIEGQLSGIPAAHFIGAHLLWWFPALLLVGPGAIFAWRKVVRAHEFGFTDALPLCWCAAGFIPVFIGGRQEYDSLFAWSGFALTCAWAWDRLSNRWRITGITLIATVGIAAVVAVGTGVLVLPGLGHAAFQRGDNTVLAVVGLSIAICCAAAAYLVWRDRDTLAITSLLVAMVPIGLAAAESIARSGPYLSFARIARFLQTPPWQAGDILFEGPPEAVSSLAFYLQRPISFVDDVAAPGTPRERLSSDEALAQMGSTRATYLIIHRDRVPWWQAQLTARFHIYHQVTTCGMHVVVNNHP